MGFAATKTQRLGLPLTIATGFSLLFVVFGLWGFWTNYLKPAGVDFVSFWAAGHLVIAGHPASAYDINIHRMVERTVAPHVGLIPFPYPPPFLIVVTPFALIQFKWAFIAWVCCTGAFYAVRAKQWAPLPYAFANPPVLVDLMIGQTGFFTAGLFLLGFELLPSAPFAAGAVLGLFLIKPQLAALLPVALAAGREWHAIAGAILSSAAALVIAFFLYGAGTYESFFSILPHYVGYMRSNAWDWVELASPFAFLRYLGAAPAASLIVQALIAAFAASITLVAWLQNWSEKVGILAAASLLISPYLLTYDALLLIIPAAYLIKRRHWWALLLLWSLCALPVLHFYDLYQGPNTIPLAALFACWNLRERAIVRP
jgi:hypothetical protein